MQVPGEEQANPRRRRTRTGTAAGTGDTITTTTATQDNGLAADSSVSAPSSPPGTDTTSPAIRISHNGPQPPNDIRSTQDSSLGSPQYRRRQFRRSEATATSSPNAAPLSESSGEAAGSRSATLRRRIIGINGANKENIGPDGEPIIDFENLAEEIRQQTELPVEITKRESIPANSMIYFYPIDKSEADTANFKRDLEEEGFFVERNSNIYWFNLKRMEERLKRTNVAANAGATSRWFGSDNKMLTSVDKIISIPSRPIYAVREATEFLQTTPQGVVDDELAVIPAKPQMFPLTEDSEQQLISDSSASTQPSAGKNIYRLVFNLHELEFLEHPLMIEETRAAKQLQSLVQMHNSRIKGNIAAYWESKLSALQVAYREFKIKYPDAESYKHARRMKMLQSAPSRPSSRSSSFSVKTIDRRSKVDDSDSENENDDNLIYLEKRREYLIQIRKLHDRYEKESSNDRMIEWRILKTWERLKIIRKSQSFSSTKSRIVVRRQDTDIDAGQSLRERYIATYMNELQELFDIEKEVNESSVTSENSPIIPEPSEPMLIKSDDNHQQERRTNFSRRKRGKTSSVVFDDSATFDREITRQWIEKNAETSFRPPGSPVLKIILTDLEEVSPDSAVPIIEQLRRSHLENRTIVLRLLVNGKEVLKTEGKQFGFETLTLGFSGEYEDFIVQTIEPPRTIKIEVYEKSANVTVKVADIPLKLPNDYEQIRTIDQELTQIEFEGIPFKISRDHESFQNPTWSMQAAIETKYNGQFRYVTVWDVDENGNIMAPRTNMRRNDEKEKLADSEFPISDPNDPRFVAKKTGEDLKEDHASKHQDAAATISDELSLGQAEKHSKRNELLILRNQSKIDIKKPIPQEEEQISDSFFDMNADVDYKASQMLRSPQATFKRSMNNLAAAIPSTGLADTSQDFLKRIRTHQLYKSFLSQQLHRSLTFDDYVREEKLPEKTETSFLEDLFRQRRKLRPERKLRSTRTVPNPTECNIVVHIARGINIPVRLKDVSQKGSDESVNSYVEIQFQRNKQRTSCQEGPSPQWNESVTLQFEPPNNDYRPENLQNVRDNIYLNIFDEVTIDMLQDDRERSNKVYQRKERKWLGTLTIPFSALYQNIVVEGKFFVRTPILNFGYGVQSYSSTNNGKLQVVSNDAILELYLTLEPALVQPPALVPKFDSDEEFDLLRIASRWKQSLPNNGKLVTATAIGLNGKTSFITRYIQPLSPPPGVDTEEKVMRFVSMVPYFQDRTALATSLDLWSNAQEMLDIGAGDEAEHAILLCNYLLHLKRRAWVVLGKANPEGKAAYVLVETDSHVAVDRPQTEDVWSWLWPQYYTRRVYFLYNPLTGTKFDSADPLCPLVEVYCLFNQQNIWANIQKVRPASKLNFDLQNTASWKPLFSNTNAIEVSRSLQRESLKYEVPPKEQLRELERTISQVLSSKIEKWRGRFVTKWNRSGSRTFEGLLPKFELHRQGVFKISMEEHLAEVGRIQAVYSIRGFPINCSFTDIDSIIEAVQNTDVYENEDPTAEFALATYCHGYVTGVISVWIYVACLTRTLTGVSNGAATTSALYRRLY